MFRFLIGETPVPVPPSAVEDNLVTPGVWGFVITFSLVVAVVLLIIDMVRRLRRLNYRASVLEQIAIDADARAKAGIDKLDERD